MRPIDADELIYEIVNTPLAEGFPYDKEWFDRLQSDIHKIIDMVENAPTVNEWISVKERLPETGGEYLAGWYGSEDVVLARFTNDCFGMKFSLCGPEKEHRPAFYYEDDEWGTCEWEDIECWMQKPVPPEVEG